MTGSWIEKGGVHLWRGRARKHIIARLSRARQTARL